MSKELDLKAVKQIQKEIILLNQANALLGWDMETYLPKKGFKARAEQLSLIKRLVHEKLISKELFERVERLKKGVLEGDDKIMIERLHRDLMRARKLPKEFVERLSKVTALAFDAWREAKEKEDFSIFKPYLEEIVELKRQEAGYIKLKGHIYNSLLDDYEEGMTVEEIKPHFMYLKEELKKIIEKIKSSNVYKTQKKILLKKKFPEEKQIEFTRDVSKRIGLKKEFSRIDLTEHPMTIRVGEYDVRITTNIRDSPLFSFHSTMHEAGHGLYETNFPKEHIYDILCDAPSMGLHESQSRFWENMIGKSMPFWRYYFPKFNKIFRLNGNFNQWYKEVNLVEPNMIRIESSEVYYCLHIILRFEIELGLIEGSIQVADLPKIWNEKMQELFGLTPKNDKEGVLQDVHWSQGYFGYFPTYALGTIYAAQIYKALKKSFPQIENEIEKGEYSKISEWLKEKIHKYGRKFLAEEMIKKVCGEGLNPKTYIDYLKEKYSKVYNIQIK